MQGAHDFFSLTKKIHNALQGGDINLTKRKMRVYEEIVLENSLRNHLEDLPFVIIHDPQPLPMIQNYKRKGPWVWRLHIDLTRPNPKLWQYLKPWIEQYNAVIVSLPEYRKKLKVPQLLFYPAIDPYSFKNRDMTEDEMTERLHHYNIPTDKPLVVQISRFDKWKDPEGVIKAFKIAKKKVKNCRLVLLGNIATDDPEGVEVYQSLLSEQSDDIIMPPNQDAWMVNALQRKAAVIIQKSIREGFGLTVTEAMWKETPVIGGNCGGIKHQITNGKDGFLVNSVQECADRIIQVLEDKRLAKRIGKAAKETVRKKFLLTRLMEQYLDLFHSFETVYKFKAASRTKYF